MPFHLHNFFFLLHHHIYGRLSGIKCSVAHTRTIVVKWNKLNGIIFFVHNKLKCLFIIGSY